MSVIDSFLSELPDSDQANPSFQLLYERYSTKVYSHCLYLTKNHELAQDYTQDIFLKLFYKLNTFQGKSHILTWLHAITFNYCHDQLRRSRRLPMESLPAQLETIAEEASDDFDEQLAWRIYRQLPQETRRLLELKYEQGMSLSIMSQELSYTISALKMRLLRSRRQVRLAYQLHVDQ